MCILATTTAKKPSLRGTSPRLSQIRDRTSVPVGVTTGAWFLPHPRDRRSAIASWTVLPDFASVNFHEPGAADIAALLLERGVAVEPGLWNADAARALMEAGIARACLRILLEPMDQSLDDAIATIDAIEAEIRDVPASVPRLLHGLDDTAWPVLEMAHARGYQTRIGLEDTLRMPDGTAPHDNADLVRAALAHIRTVDATRDSA